MSAEPRPDVTEPETGAVGPEVEGVAESEAAAETEAAAEGWAAAEASPEASALSEARERVAALEAENAKLKDQALRALADAENIRRRSEREREDTAKYAISGFAKSLLDAADNLRRAIDAVPGEAVETDAALKTLVDGVAATERQLLAAFERNGLTRIEPVDEIFDPNFHQAMFELPGTGKPAGTVVQVVQPGYVLQGRLLRPALVGVAKGE
ncbi:nucleotide exchange factor GrpE [Inquilinus limosus]|uniref:nucleotide exchange factor GrpE n=1 Tax=Inquilinus limosus TaxID=171674 RepID=UPI003F18C692